MELNHAGREFYDLELVARDETDEGSTPLDPQPTGYEASFDDGETWVAGTMNDDTGRYEWLVAGPDFENPSPATALTVAGAVPLGRLTDSPEVIIRSWPAIHIR